MQEAKIPTPPEDTADTAKYRQIMDGARDIFLANGFDGASMNDIARCAGVSKGTIYAYFPSKEELFAAFIRHEKTQQAEHICKPNVTGDNLAAEMERFLTELLTALARPSSIAQIRTVIGAAAKHAALGRAYYAAGAQYGIARISEFLREQTECGRLSITDFEEAAVVLVDLAKSRLFQRLIFGVETDPDHATIAAQAKRAVQIFLTLYGVKPEAAP